MVNSVHLVGRLGGDPELRYTPNGNAVASFSVATSEKYKDKEGNQQEKTEWHRVIVWNKPAEACHEYLRKGSLVFVGGKITYRSYDDKDGVKHNITEIVANRVRFLGGLKEKPIESTEEGGLPGRPPVPEEDKDLPF